MWNPDCHIRLDRVTMRLIAAVNKDTLMPEHSLRWHCYLQLVFLRRDESNLKLRGMFPKVKCGAATTQALMEEGSTNHFTSCPRGS